MKVALSRIHYPVTTLGPGRRIGIWFQGCSIRCPGCISLDTWDRKPADTEVVDVVRTVGEWLPECDGITISGGEPFDQPEGLFALLSALRNVSRINILVYSGHPYQRILSSAAMQAGLVDALISEPFMKDSPQTLALRGSDNQRLHLLTEAGSQSFAGYEREVTTEEKRLDVMFDADGAVWLAGIPGRGDMTKFQSILLAQGHTAVTTEGRS